MKILKLEQHWNDPNRYFIKTKEKRLPKEGDFFLYKEKIWPAMSDFQYAEELIYREISIKLKRR